MSPSEAFEVLRAMYPKITDREILSRVSDARPGDLVTAPGHEDPLQVVQVVDSGFIKAALRYPKSYITACKVHKGVPLTRTIAYRGEDWTVVGYSEESIDWLLSEDCHAAMARNVERLRKAKARSDKNRRTK
jgi:hypothetical protein